MTNSLPDGPAGTWTSVIGAQAESESGTIRALAFSQRELRSGDWTRLGGERVLGDIVTEHALSALAADAQAAARAQGYATGWAEGRRAAEEQAREEAAARAERQRRDDERRDAEHRSAVAALVRVAGELEATFAATCAQVETHAVQLAAQLTQELVGHELAVAETPGLDAVRRAMALLPGEPVARIRIAPEEAATPGLAELAGSAVVIPDPSLRRGDALVEADASVVDARVSTALHRVLEVLA